MKTLTKPELLVPAGNLEKLKIAFAYGADACYIGGTVFGLRKFADNFSEEDMIEGIALANALGKKVYLVLNGFAHNEDIEQLIPYFDTVERIHPHALIISDMGVLRLAKQHTTIPLHASTQASITNKLTCQLYKDAGAERIILAREVTIQECEEILEEVDTELEVFVHGAMCASYSGKCVISNYISGRDSNRGGCVQSCRHTYSLNDVDDQGNETTTDTTHIMNAKDLMAVSLLPRLMTSGIASFKIEGRMKSNMYAANCASIYRQAIDECYNCLSQNKPFDPTPYEAELNKVSNRTFSTGGLDHRPFHDSIHNATSNCTRQLDFIGTVKSVIPQQGIFVDVKIPFSVGDELERMSPQRPTQRFSIQTMTNMQGEPIEHARPNSLVQLPWMDGVHELDILRAPL